MVLFDLCCSRGGDAWDKAARELGMRYISYSWDMLNTQQKRMQVLSEAIQSAQKQRTVILFSSHGMDKGLEEFFSGLTTAENMILLPVGADAMLLNRGNVNSEYISKVNEYVVYGGDKNIFGLMAYLRKYVFEDQCAPLPPEPEKTPFDGIYSISDNQVFVDIDSFLQSEEKEYPIYVGMLSHRSSWLTHSLQVELGLIQALHEEGVGVIPVFSSGEKSELVQSFDFQEIVDHYFSRDGKLFIQGLVNFQMHLIKSEYGLSVAENSVRLFSVLDIPVFHPISSYSTTTEKWDRNQNPLADEMQYAYLNPEMAGMTEPVLVSLRDKKDNSIVTLEDNMKSFAKRVKKWMILRTKPNSQKKIALMLHNSVCAGVEATIGKAFGLDAFESTVKLMHRLEEDGYCLENIPENGEALRNLLMEKKAFSDFRWTSVEDIIQSGGCLYRMPVHDEYLEYFDEFTPQMRKQMLDSWGPPPGEGMVMGDNLIITGLSFGNLTILVQPKRGCYGAKCTGEVCKILHDPNCPPTHQYIATYRYLERVMKVDAIIHMGTEGSLEYLPGKGSGLDQQCWSYAVLGCLPNLYPYHIGVISEGTIAKRRANAVMFGHYPASSSGFDSNSLELMDYLNAYCEAVQMENGQETVIRKKIENMLQKNLSQKKLLEDAESFFDGVQLVRSSLLRCAEGRKITRLHVFGENPPHEEAINYLCELLHADGILQPEKQEDEFQYHRKLHDFVEVRLIDENLVDPMSVDIRNTYRQLMRTYEEEELLLHALKGGFIPSSEGGMPDENGRKILPSGRNFYMMNLDKIPSQTAYERGKILAEQLISAYRVDEGCYPKKIAMNMISLDIARTHGEQLSQFLYLLGVRPIWDRQGRVIRLEAIPLQELGRPRIDITLRISGVMRDTWPAAVALMDDAVLMVSSLEESDSDNYILANIHQMETECGKLGDRARTIRIFGDPPGAFGAGIDLALKASAWDDDKDLARYFIQSSAFAYGKGLDGRKSIQEFVQNAKSVDLSCDVSSSRRMDTLACGFGLQVHGGFKKVAEVIGGKKIRQYQSTSELNTKIETMSLAKKVEKDIYQTLLNASWIDSTKRDGYTGASEMMHRMQNVFDAKCTSECIEDRTLNQLAEVYVNDPQMREWLLDQNPYAAEEITRRLLELHSRGKWKPDEELLEKIQENYLSIEGCMEGVTGGNGEIQGGSVEIVRDDKIENWSRNLKEIDDYLSSLNTGKK